MPRLPPPGRTFGSCQPGSWRYHELPASAGATCLDGSPYGFYFMNGIVNRRDKMRYNETWLLLFEGGGWSPVDGPLASSFVTPRARGRRGASARFTPRERSASNCVYICK